MKCPKCNQDLEIKVASKAYCKKCKVLSTMTTVLTIICESCNHVFQVPVNSKSFLNIKEE